MQYHVLSLRPGMHRGGRANPQHAVYQPGDHTPAQFRDLLGDPNFVVITGGERMTAGHVDAMVEANVAIAETKIAEMQAVKGKKA